MSSSNQAPTKMNRGRQKVKMVKIENENKLQVSFSKRRAGLFKKASELSVLCGVKTLIIVFSPAKKAFSYGHPDVEIVANKFLNEDTPNPASPNIKFNQMIMEAARNSNIHSRNLKLTQINNMVSMERRKASRLKALKKQGQVEGWIAPSIEKFNLEQLIFFEKTIENYEKQFDENVIKCMSHNPNPGLGLNVANELYSTSGMNVTSNVGSSMFVPSNNLSFSQVSNDVPKDIDTVRNALGGINNSGEFPFLPNWINTSWATDFGDKTIYTSSTSIASHVGGRVSDPNEFYTWSTTLGDTRVYATGEQSVTNNFLDPDLYDTMGMVKNDHFTSFYNLNAPYGVARCDRPMTGEPSGAILYGDNRLSVYPGFFDGGGPSQF